MVHLHLLAPIIALATSRETYEAVFPKGEKFNPQPLYDLGVDAGMIPSQLIKSLAPLGPQFEAIHSAWQDFSGYQEPPCPDGLRLSRLVQFTKELGPLA
jgi:hypothetical protein